jgi:hypothetical protein
MQSLRISKLNLLSVVQPMTGRNCSHSAIQLGQTLFTLFALALDLPENYFDDKVHAIRNACYMCSDTSHRLLDLLRSCGSSIILHRILQTLTIGRLALVHIQSKL